MKYRATIVPLYEGHRQVAKTRTEYTNAASESQAGRFLRIRYPYPKFLVENIVADEGKLSAMAEKPMGSCYSCGYPLAGEYGSQISCPYCQANNISTQISSLSPMASGGIIAAGFLLIVFLATRNSDSERRIY
jgi:predicted RNA-binding Zn-ribbon protein involved in translation (DUF1610 family)